MVIIAESSVQSPQPVSGCHLQSSPTKSVEHSDTYHFSLKLGHNPHTNRSTVIHQYTTYPYRLSHPLQIDPTDRDRTYLYLMNTSPGIFAGDDLRLKVELDSQTQLHLTDQAATKIHRMPDKQGAKLLTQIHLGPQTSLEYLPEPLILYSDSQFEQTTHVKLDPTATLFLSETILPGRIARDEWYAFRHYFGRLKIFSTTGDLLIADSMGLQGQGNPLINSPLLTQLPAIASIIIILPNVELETLITQLQTLPDNLRSHCRVGCTKLPNTHGLIIRAIADRTNRLKHYTHFCLNCVRQATQSPTLPEIPK